MRSIIFKVLVLCLFCATAATAAPRHSILAVPLYTHNPETLVITAQVASSGKPSPVTEGTGLYSIFDTRGRPAGASGRLLFSRKNRRWESNPIPLSGFKPGEYFAFIKIFSGNAVKAEKRLFFFVSKAPKQDCGGKK